MRKLLILFILIPGFIFGQNSTFNNSFKTIGGTTTITIITGDTIWVAADSKRTETNEVDKITGHNTFLKIMTTGALTYTFTGSMPFISNEKNIEVFNAYEIMNDALIKEPELEKGFALFNGNALKKLDSLFKIMPQRMLKNLQEKLDRKLIEVVLVTFVNGHPKIINCDYGFSKIGEEIKFIYKIKDQNQTLPFIVFTGYTEEIHKAIDNVDYFGEATIKEDLVNLIRLEVKSNPEKVGFPIYVLRISKNSKDLFKFDN